MIIKVIAYNTKFMTKYINLLLLPHLVKPYKKHKQLRTLHDKIYSPEYNIIHRSSLGLVLERHIILIVVRAHTIARYKNSNFVRRGQTRVFEPWHPSW